MSHIGEIQPGAGTPLVKSAATLQAQQTETRPVETQKDRAEFSEVARYMSEMRDLPDVRMDKVEEVRAAIARGDYDRQEVIDKTIANLVEDLR